MSKPTQNPLSTPAPVVSAVVDGSGARVPLESIHFGSLLRARGLISGYHLEKALALQAENPYLRIGEILLGLGYITFAQLKNTLEDQYRDVKLGDALLRHGLVSVAQLDEALATQELTGRRLAPLLIEQQACTEADIYRALALQDPA